MADYITKKQKFITKKEVEEPKEYITKKEVEEPTKWITKKKSAYITKKKYAGGGRALRGLGKAFMKGGKV